MASRWDARTNTATASLLSELSSLSCLRKTVFAKLSSLNCLRCAVFTSTQLLTLCLPFATERWKFFSLTLSRADRDDRPRVRSVRLVPGLRRQRCSGRRTTRLNRGRGSARSKTETPLDDLVLISIPVGRRLGRKAFLAFHDAAKNKTGVQPCR
jgi:hypothetical protein